MTRTLNTWRNLGALEREARELLHDLQRRILGQCNDTCRTTLYQGIFNRDSPMPAMSSRENTALKVGRNSNSGCFLPDYARGTQSVAGAIKAAAGHVKPGISSATALFLGSLVRCVGGRGKSMQSDDRHRKARETV